jgi:hypothetical protein
MKSILQNLAVFLAAIYLSGCESQERKTSSNAEQTKAVVFEASESDTTLKKDFCRESGAGNFLISRTEGEKMINHFKSIYTKDRNGTFLPGVQLTFWVDDCTIHALKNLLYWNEGEFDGVRVVFAAFDDQNKTTSFYFVPTKRDQSDRQETRHPEEWNYSINLTGCASTSFFSSHQGAITNIQRFGRIYAEKPADTGSPVRDSLTQKCWINKCVIRSLSDILTRHSSTLDGVNIKLAAYERINSLAGGQHKENQSTIILVPAAAGSHDDVWAVNEFFIQSKDLSGYNHSQLCPQFCL